ncbi:sensor histidine kinase, partial [Burkholderia sp. SIMBA_013]
MSERIPSAPPAPRPLLPSRSLARHLVIRLMPPILLLVLLDLAATWVITHKIDMSLWMLEDFFWLMVVGQVMLIGLF